MKRAFVYKDEKSDKFWWINYSESDFAVNYGKNGSTGILKNIIFRGEEWESILNHYLQCFQLY